MMRISQFVTYSFAVLTPWFLGGQDSAIANSPSNYQYLGASALTIKTPSTNVLLGESPVPLGTAYPEVSASQQVNRLGAISNLATPSLRGGIVDETKVDWVPQTPTRNGRNANYLQNSPSTSPLVRNPRIPSGEVSPVYKLNQPVSRTLFSQSNNSPQSPNSSPAQERIRQLRERLRSLRPKPPRSSYPGLNIANPSGFGADNYRGFVGLGLQSRTRFSNSSGGLIGGGLDGTLGFGFGLGDARESVGLQLSYTMASFGGSRPFGSGGVNAKLHTRFDGGWGVALGGDGIINVGALPEGSPTKFNDFENTYYVAATKLFRLRRDINAPFSRAGITVGAGTGRFRSADQIINRENAIGFFGSAGVQALPWISLITEWTGQDLAVGASIAPFKNIPLVINPAFRDITGAGDGARFVVGIGGSIGDVISLIDWIF